MSTVLVTISCGFKDKFSSNRLLVINFHFPFLPKLCKGLYLPHGLGSFVLSGDQI